MGAADREESEMELDPEAVKGALAELRERRNQVQEQQDGLTEEGASQQVRAWERDARLMKTARHGYQVCLQCADGGRRQARTDRRLRADRRLQRRAGAAADGDSGKGS